MKKALLTLAIVLLVVAAQAQIKLHSDSHVSLGTISNSWNVGTQIYPSGTAYFNTQNTNNWHWVTMSSPNAVKGKCWIVSYPGNKYDHRFFVTADGYTHHRGSWRAADASLQSNINLIIGAGGVLDSITGVWYIPNDEGGGAKREEDRRAGVTAQNVKKVLPEAVTSDENGLLYVDYESLTVFLIEAMKEQRRETELIRKALEENGFMEPRKP